MTNTRAGSEMLHESLAHLNEASKERRDEIQKLLDEKYTDLKSAFGGAARASAGWVKEQSREVGDTAVLAANTVDQSVRRYPWAYVGGAAVSGLLIGLLVAGRRK